MLSLLRSVQQSRSNLFKAAASAATNSIAEQELQLFGACVLERLPIVAPDDAEWEREYAGWQDEWHASHYKTLPQEVLGAGQSEEPEVPWTPAPRTTEADRRKDTRSVHRALDRRLYLLVKPKGQGRWQFPRAVHAAGEGIRQTAERALAEAIEPGPQVYFVGNAPMGHVQQESTGLTVFMKAQLVAGRALPASGTAGPQDFAWLLREELPAYFSDPQMQALLQGMLSR